MPLGEIDRVNHSPWYLNISYAVCIGCPLPEFTPKWGFTGGDTAILDVVGIPTVAKNGTTAISKIKGWEGGLPTSGNWAVYVSAHNGYLECRWAPQNGFTDTPSAEEGLAGISYFKLPPYAIYS